MSSAGVPRFRALAGVHEPSAIQQLPDGRFLVAEDEKERPFSLVTLLPDGAVRSTALEIDAGGELAKLDDLEGLTLDAAGRVYAITSHSRSGKGKEKPSREKLLRFRVEGNRMVSPAVCTGLKAALVASHPALAEAAAVRDVKNEGGLNIEALEMSPDGGRLLIGLRSPLLDGRAVLATLANPSAVFDADMAPVLSPQLTLLDLDGDGLRALSWIAALDGYLLIGGPGARAQAPFRLWFWRGRAGDAPRRAGVAGLAGLARAEGISPARLDGREGLVIVSDDGSHEAGRPAQFLLLDPAQIQLL
ncbi:MAG: DUF3616 domain-containing protein [Rhodocyclaceae bacterium]|jgi:hypothetical protein|nr:DUF3616 domain-containing protein [Rhodocyclaceae bacterium]MCL4680877.1 DUF3616 domain-containing protein [Rhodocyclaceae bacterium]